MRFVLNPFTGLLDVAEIGGTGGLPVLTLTGNSGGAVSPDGSGNIDFVGSNGITIVGNPGTNTLTAEFVGALGLTWALASSGTNAMSNMTGWITNSSSLTTFTLPTSGSAINFVMILGSSTATGGWKITYTGSQYIQLGIDNSTVGSGNISSSHPSDSVLLFSAIGYNGQWFALPFGNLNYA